MQSGTGWKKRSLFMSGAALALAGFVVPSAGAQQAASPGSDAAAQEADAFGDIVVTAQRREERLQDVPVAVTAISAAQLESQRIQDVQGLNSLAPSIVVSPGLSSSDVSIGLRGVSPTDNEVTVDATVGVYINGLYLARTAGTNATLVDLQRVEVLRGPQGTLFGRNTIGGALQIATQQPTDEMEGSVSVDVGNYNTFNGLAIANIPLVDDVLSGRLVYSHRQRDGYVDNTFLGIDQGWIDEDYVRGTLAFTPNSNFSATLYVDHFTGEGNSTPIDPVYFRALNGVDPTAASLIAFFNGNPTDSFGNYLDGDPQTTAGNFDKLNTQEGSNVIATLSYDFGGATLTSITGYRDYDARRGSDLDGSPYTLVSIVRDDVSYQEITQELQLSGDAFGDRLSWIVGGFYFEEDGYRDITVRLLENVPDPSLPPYFQVTTLPQLRNTSNSVFAQLTYAVTPDVRVTGGLRYVRDERFVTYHNFLEDPATGAFVMCTIPGALNPGAGCTYSPPHSTYEFMPWTLGVDFKASEDILLYAKASQGYRSGGFQLQGGLTPDQFEPVSEENLLSYEVGAKTTLFDGRLLFNVAAYTSTYEDIQQTNNAVDPGTGQIIQLIRNSGEADIQGAEVEFRALLGNLSINGGASYVNAEYTAGPAIGSEVLLTPEWTWTLGADYPVHLDIGDLTFHADANYRSSTFAYPTDGLPADQADALSTPGYTLINANVTLSLPTGLELSLWGKNLTDEDYHFRTVNFNSLGYNPAYPGDPLTYGATVRYHF